MDQNIYTSRQAALRELAAERDLQAVILNPGPSLTYFTGLHFHLSERPIVFVLPLDEEARLVLPELEAGKAEELSYPVQTYTYAENPAIWGERFTSALASIPRRGFKVGMEFRQMRLLEYNLLLGASPDIQLHSAETIIAQLRMTKSADELAHMRDAVAIAETALTAALPQVRPGMTEIQVAALLTSEILTNGSEPQLPFTPLIASGPNSANPHSFPTDRELQDGDVIIIDWGATSGGYYSDITRTFYLGDISEELQTAAEVVLRANTNARGLSVPDLRAKAIDNKARQTIEDAGFGEYFTHRTGHGLGLDGHEPPYIHSESETVLQEGMTFTIEPGIYLPGNGGIRIEDDVVYQDNHIHSLTTLPREIRQLG